MACSSKGVWVSIQNSANVRLFHATTCEFLMEVSLTNAVSQKLMGKSEKYAIRKNVCYDPLPILLFFGSLLRVLPGRWIHAAAD
jgi:hypothetical protein